MLRKLLKIADTITLPEKSLVVIKPCAVTLNIIDDFFTIEKNPSSCNKFEVVMPVVPKTSGSSPAFGSDQSKYLFPNFLEKSPSKKKHLDECHSDYLAVLDMFCAETQCPVLSRLRKTIEEIVFILKAPPETLDPSQIEQRNILQSLSYSDWVNICIDGVPLTQNIVEKFFNSWVEYQLERFGVLEYQSCSVCAQHNKILPKLPSPLNKFFSSKNECSHQYCNTNSSICVSCAMKVNNVLNNMKKYVVKTSRKQYELVYLLNPEEDISEEPIDEIRPRLRKLHSNRSDLLCDFLNHVLFATVVERNMGRSVYYSMDISGNIRNFFINQEDYLPQSVTQYYSILDLSEFFRVKGDKTGEDVARGVFFKYAVTGQLENRDRLLANLVKQIIRHHKHGAPIDTGKIKVILNVTGEKMSEDLSIRTLGRLLYNMSRVQRGGNGKRFKRTFVERFAHRLVDDPTLIGYVIGEFRKNYGDKHRITVENWEKDIQGLPSRRLTAKEVVLFHISIEEERNRLIDAKKSKNIDQETLEEESVE